MSRLVGSGLCATRRTLLAGSVAAAGLGARIKVSLAAGRSLPLVLSAQSGLPAGLPRRVLLIDDPAHEQAEPQLAASDGTPIPLAPIGEGPALDEGTGLLLRLFAFNPSLPQHGPARLTGVLPTPIEIPVSPEDTHAITRALLRALQFQRCGTAVADVGTGLRRRPCHLVDSIQEDPHDPAIGRDASGGWHDGPGYGKSVVAAARTIGALMEAHCDNPELVGDGALGIPESGNGRADLKDELKFGADWLLSMEGAEGAFFAGIGVEGAGAIVAADEDIAKRTLRARSPEATAAAACALASLSRQFADEAPGRQPVEEEFAAIGVVLEGQMDAAPDGESYADRCRGAAERGLSALARSRAPLPASGYAEAIAAWQALGRPQIPGADPGFWQVAVEALSADPQGWPLGAALSLAESAGRAPQGLGNVGEVAQVRMLEAAEASLATDPHLNPPRHGETYDLEAIVSAGGLQVAAHRLTGAHDFLMAAAARAEVPLGLNRFGRVLVTGFEGETPLGIFEAQSISLEGTVPGLAYAALGQEGEDWYLAKGSALHEISIRSIRMRPMRLRSNAALSALLLALDEEARRLAGGRRPFEG